MVGLNFKGRVSQLNLNPIQIKVTERLVLFTQQLHKSRSGFGLLHNLGERYETSFESSIIVLISSLTVFLLSN